MSSVTVIETKPARKPAIQVIARNTAFMLSGQILLKVLAFVFNVYVVRRLGDAHFGRYSAALAYVAIFAMFTDLGTSSLSVREMARKAGDLEGSLGLWQHLRDTASNPELRAVAEEHIALCERQLAERRAGNSEVQP